MSYAKKQFIKFVIVPATVIAIAVAAIIISNPTFCQSGW